MIRRPAHASDGTSCWVLVSQIEHARLAAELARHWGANGVAPLWPADEVWQAILHHDDGWATWEAAPQIDPQTARPRSFTEMPLADTLGIWRSSIDLATTLGNLAPWMVAGHFSALLRGAATTATAAQTWLAEFDARRRQWLAAWQAADAVQNTVAVAERNLALLQMFDAMSLWFCCDVRTKPTEFTVPDGPRLRFAPAADPPGDTVEITPWPWSVAVRPLSATGTEVPARAYGNTAELAAAPQRPVELTWTLQPAD